MLRKNGLLFPVCLLVLMVLVAAPVMAQDSSNTVPPVVSLDVGDVLSILVGWIGLTAGIIAVVVAALRGGKSADAGVTASVEARQRDRDWMERNERAYQQASDERKQMFGLMVGFLEFFSPMTRGIKTDDAFLRLLRDVQQPGVPADLPPAPAAAPDAPSVEPAG